MAAFQIDGCDNIRMTFTGDGTTTITPNAAAGTSHPLNSKLASGDFFWGVARGVSSGEESIGYFTFNGTTVAQTEVWKSSNSNTAVAFSSGSQCEINIDLPGKVLDELNLRAITVASAATCDIGAAQSAKIIISGTTTITSLGTTAHKRRFVKFSGALTLTYNATSLILPGGKNIPTAAGDTAIFMSDSSGNWTCWSYTPAAGTIVSVNKQTIVASGTYTPSAGMKSCIIECIGGAAGGGGVTGAAGAKYFGAGGGGAGGYSRYYGTAATAGASQTVTIGAGGAGGIGSANGANGGDTSVGTLCIGKGGSGGTFTANGVQLGTGGAGGVAGTGDVTGTGAPGGPGFYNDASVNVQSASGVGGSSAFGGGGAPVGGSGALTGNAGTGKGAGGSGAYVGSVASSATGGAGTAGLVIITEFCTQ